MITLLLYTTLTLFIPRSCIEHENEHSALHTLDCYTFTVDNAATDSLGDVSVNGVSANTNIEVTGNGFFEQDICFAAVSVTIQGNVVAYPNAADFQLADGTWVRAGWQSASLVEVKNEEGQNGPER